ncbi:MAG: type II toxin-antitoxin system VapC family toxin [Acidimicrobiia bacterium]
MALVYFDASALVKLVVEEEGSDLAARLWDSCDAALASRLAHVEACAALAASHRNRDLSRADLDAALAGLDGFWAAVRAVELDPSVQRNASRLARDHALRGADAVHLASALAVGHPDLVVAVWDRRLAAATLAAGLPVTPPPD